MKYTGQFKNINNTLYQIDIDINNGITGSTELVLSDEPFKVEYNNDKVIYSPLKLSNATCTILSDKYLFDIYQSTAQGCKMTLTNLDNNSIEWVGYVTPNIYTQGFENVFESIDIEAIDGLSTLDNYTYQQIDIDNKKIKSFQDILISIISRCDCYKNIYINQNNYLVQSTVDYTSVINKLLIAEQNFFNDDAQVATDTTAAVAATSMTYKEVLTEIMQFLGYTAVAFGDSIYILDYDYIKNSYTDYTLYTTSNNWSTYSTSQVVLNQSYDINNDSFKSNGGTIELDTTYNQVSIKTNLNNKDSLLPDFFDDAFLYNISSASHNWNDYVLTFSGGNTYYNKYYKHNEYITYWYSDDVNWTEISFDYTTLPILENNIGAIVSRQASFTTSTGTDSVSFNNYIQLVRHMQANPSSTQNILKPLLYNIAGSMPQNSYLYDTYYIVIAGSACWTDLASVYYIDQTETRKTDTNFSQDNLYLTATLQIGNKYWNGSIWTTIVSTFKIQFKKGDETHLINKWFSVKNQVSYQDFIDSTGQKIPIKATDQLYGDVNFMLYTPQSVISDYRVDNVFLKDFSVKLVNQNSEKDTTTDTQYLNVIDTNYINQFSDLDFKVCSQTNKGMNYSSVIEYNPTTNGFKYNQSIFNRSLNKSQLQEYNIIEKYVNQYSEPQKKLNITLANNYKPFSLFTCGLYPDDKYIVDKMSIDYYNDTNLLTIINKK